MGLHLDVKGEAEFKAFAAQARAEKAAKRKRIGDAMKDGVEGLRMVIPVEALIRLPSGYGPVMARSVKVSSSVRLGRGARVVVRVHAKGKAQARDVSAVDEGRLKHPLFGNRKRWYTTRVRDGFAYDPFAARHPIIVRKVDRVLDDMVDRLERG